MIIDLEPAAENSLHNKDLPCAFGTNVSGKYESKSFYWANELYPNFDLEEAKRYADAFHLSMKQKIRKLSTGYQSIFMLISALASNAEYLLFDEPVLGLDVNNRDFFYRILLEKYAQNECGIIVSTHLIEEVEEILENIIIIHEGKILRNEPVEDLLKTVYQVSGPATLLSEFAKDKDVLHRHALGGLMTATIKGSFEGDLPEGLERSKVDLRQLFIELTGQYELEPVLNQQSKSENNMKTKQALKYQLHLTMKSLAIFFFLYLAMVAVVILVTFFGGEGAEQEQIISSGDGAAIFFMLVMGIVAYRETLRFMIQHGVSRKETMLASVANSAICAATISIANVLLNMLFSAIQGDMIFRNVSELIYAYSAEVVTCRLFMACSLLFLPA